MDESFSLGPRYKPLVEINGLKDINFKMPALASGNVIPPGIDLLMKKREYEEKREEENRQNLSDLNRNSVEIIDKLEKQISQKDEDLQNQREMINLLRNQLVGIQRTLSDMFILEESNTDLIMQATDTAKEISALIIQGKKIDWKLIALDKGIDVLLAAIPIILQLLKVV